MNKFFSIIRALIIITGIGAVLTSCMVGPDFKPPEAPATEDYVAAPLPEETTSASVTGGDAQRFIRDRDIPAQWWIIFNSEPLNRLIRQAMAENPSLAAATAALKEALENYRAGGGALYPAIDAGFSASRAQVSGASYGQPNISPSIFTLYNASVSVAYTLDIFGATRRNLEALGAQVDYRQYLMEGTRLTMAANIITAAVQEASLRAQIQATREIIAAEEEQLKLVERRFQLGGAARSDILAQQTQLAQTLAELPTLEKSLAQTRHLLVFLTGRLPSEATDYPEFELESLTLPKELPLSLPSALVRQRPDIRAAEEFLHAACAQVGVATANLYPQITISGKYGSESTVFKDLFSGDTVVWGISSGLTAPIFRGGELTARKRAAVAAFDQAAAQYRSTVLQAFQNVADVLRAIEADARALSAQTDAEKAALDSLQLTQKEFELGAVSTLMLLNAQRQHQQAKIALARARAARFSDTVALFQALGGGWGSGTDRQADKLMEPDRSPENDKGSNR